MISLQITNIYIYGGDKVNYQRFIKWKKYNLENTQISFHNAEAAHRSKTSISVHEASTSRLSASLIHFILYIYKYQVIKSVCYSNSVIFDQII